VRLRNVCRRFLTGASIDGLAFLYGVTSLRIQAALRRGLPRVSRRWMRGVR
jgi:hypothetical protein